MDYSQSVYDQAQQAAIFCKKHFSQKPTVGLVLGSGLGDFAEQIEQKQSLDYEQIPFFKKSTVQGHAGKLVFGFWQGKVVVAMQGRYHFYEGHTIQEIIFPIKVMKLLGVEKLILTNAAGGVNLSLECRDLMIIKDHVNFLGANPLIGGNDERFGTRFPDMTNVYCPKLREIVKKEMNKLKISVKEGVYGAFLGPCYDTPQEIKMARLNGVDAAGMSTVPEAIVANHMGIKVIGISCITNMAAGVTSSKLDHQEVIDNANYVKENFKKLIGNLIPLI